MSENNEEISFSRHPIHQSCYVSLGSASSLLLLSSLSISVLTPYSIAMSFAMHPSVFRISCFAPRSINSLQFG